MGESRGDKVRIWTDVPLQRLLRLSGKSSLRLMMLWVLIGGADGSRG
jgi:hypothetical protein